MAPKKILSLFLLFLMIGSPMASALTVTEAVNTLQAADLTLPTGVANPKGSIGFILSTIFGTGGSSLGKIQSQYIDYSGISAWTQSGSDTFYSGTGNVGIGLSSPSFQLDVAGDASFNGVRVGRWSGAISSNTAIGYNSLYYNTTGWYNTANGNYSLYNNTTGHNNTANGYATLLSNTTGHRNTAAGYYALYSNTSGKYNTAIGNDSLFSNTLGEENTSVGYVSLYENTNGWYNTAIGNRTLRYNNTSDGQTAIGHSAGFSIMALGGSTAPNTMVGYKALYGWDTATPANNTAYDNIAVWYWSLWGTNGTPSTGYSNVAIGNRAMWNNTSGYYNTAIGTNSLSSNTIGNYNTANGRSALFANTTGSYNTANGTYALYYNTTGSGNNAKGYQSLYKNTTGSKNDASGFQSLYNNTIGYENSAVGKGTLYSNIDGYYNTAIGTNALNWNTSGTGNTALGRNALFNNGTGSSNTAIGSDTLMSNTIGLGNTVIGSSANVTVNNLTNATAIGYGASVNASNKVRIGNTSVTVIEGQVAFTNPSDKRLKEDIVDYTHGLDFITKLRPVQYRLKSDGERNIHNGFIAQEVDAIGIPFSGLHRPKTEDQYYSIAYSDFVVPLVNAVKELKKENDRLKKENGEIMTLVCLDHPDAKICK